MWWCYRWWVDVRWSVLVTGCWLPHPAFTFCWETACLLMVVYWDLQLLTSLTTISGAQCLKGIDPRWMEVIVFIKKKTQYAADSHPFMWSFSRTSVPNIIHMTYYHFTTENLGSCVFGSHDFFPWFFSLKEWVRWNTRFFCQQDSYIHFSCFSTWSAKWFNPLQMNLSPVSEI